MLAIFKDNVLWTMYEICNINKERERKKNYDHYFSEYTYLFIISNTVLSKVDYVQ